ncbi:hypothetical protein H6P81_004296 [Aristolochia fimbriata]|uniref:FLZ-type domain-containing protein n=1 Tax=Aristolochia fimbriata TaxID=158543 RepID=A0AAV7FF61_ARIFI|nr:hypothetical protein H6P81_004296 [Aristolochia fimbriata]
MEIITNEPIGLRIILVHKPRVLTRSVAGLMNHPRIAQGINNVPRVVGNFLQACRLCKKKLSPEKDVYMYRGDQAFCSVDCRCEQILLDEMCETEEYLRLRRKPKRVSPPPPLRCNAEGNRVQESHPRRRIWVAG